MGWCLETTDFLLCCIQNIIHKFMLQKHWSQSLMGAQMFVEPQLDSTNEYIFKSAAWLTVLRNWMSSGSHIAVKSLQLVHIPFLYSDHCVKLNWLSVTSQLPTILLPMFIEWVESSPSCLFMCRHHKYSTLIEFYVALKCFYGVKYELYLLSVIKKVHLIHPQLYITTGDCL